MPHELFPSEFDHQPLSRAEIDGVAGKKLKVLLLSSELEDYALEYANGLPRDCEVMLWVPERRFARFKGQTAPHVELRLLDWPRHRSLRNIAFLFRLIVMIRRADPAVVHFLANTVLWLNLLIPFLKGRTVVTTIHDVTTHPGDKETLVLPTWATGFLPKYSNYIVVHGENLRSETARKFNRPLDAIAVLDHPALTRYARLAPKTASDGSPENGRFTVLFFGRIFAYKGLKYLIESEERAAAALPAARFVIAGRGEAMDGYRQAVADAARYDFIDRFIPDEEVAALFTRADIIALPYVEASQSGVLALAAAFGKPVVATDVGELRETVERADMGLVVPPRDAVALADAIIALGRDDALRARYAAGARRYAETTISPQTVGQHALEFYRRAVR